MKIILEELFGQTKVEKCTAVVCIFAVETTRNVLLILLRLILLLFSPFALIWNAFRFKAKTYKSILITGGSRGLGAKCAEYYAKTGVQLYLLARNQQRLEDVAKICRNKGATVNIFSGDITSHDHLREVFDKADKISPIDLVIANAGILSNPWYKDPGLVCDVNVKSLIDTVTLAFEKMMPRKRGQIALIASLSGLCGGFITNPVYGATKAAVSSFANAIRVRYRKYNVGVSLINPGYIETDMLHQGTSSFNNYFVKEILTPEQTVEEIAWALKWNIFSHSFPFRSSLLISFQLIGWDTRHIFNF